MPAPPSGSPTAFPPPVPPAWWRGVDRASFAVALGTRLRGAGVPVSMSCLEQFTQALRANPPHSRSALYWTARVCLVRQRAEIPVFDEVFGAVFAGSGATAHEGHAPAPAGAAGGPDEALASVPRREAPGEDGSGLPWITLPQVVAVTEGGADDAAVAVPLRLPSELDGLADVPFEELDGAQLDLLGGWLDQALTNWPTRHSRRLVADPGARRVAVRLTVARSRRTGWEPIELVRVRTGRTPRRVVMLCDVSQSMQAQASAYLHLMRVLALAVHAEVFAFATNLTRLTAVLAHKSAALAVAQATDAVADRFGGTRIASNLRALLSSYHGNSVRGAIVIIGSDGWDSDPPEEMAAAMARLRRRAYRVIWANPRAAAPGFEPTVSTMAAALPYCDRLLPADTFRSLARVIDEIARSAAA